MSERRISAGESEDRYKTKHELYDFFDEMQSEIDRHFEEKGTSWKRCHIEYLLEQLQKCINEQDWVDAANFCFMLFDRDRNPMTFTCAICQQTFDGSGLKARLKEDLDCKIIVCDGCAGTNKHEVILESRLDAKFPNWRKDRS